jgi:hypothetical protein
MAIGWIGVFKALPWTEILAAAPVIVQGAGKLWKTVKRKDGAGGQVDLAPVSDAESINALEARIAVLEKEALASSELIRALADQNARLVEAVEILRVRTRILLGLGAASTIALFAMSAWLLWR